MHKESKIDYKYYLEDINRFKPEFEKTIQEIYELISEEMNIQQFDARIKSYNSFCNNLYSNNKIKNLDDCFGIKIMVDDDDAINRVISKLEEKGFVIRGIKDHKEKINTNYNAVHVILNFKGSTIPFEIQLRTPQRAEGRLAHDIYKMYGSKKDITHEERLKVVEEFVKVARLKMNGNYEELIKEIPICYKMKNGTIVKIGQKEIIKQLYPTAEEVFGEKLFDRILNQLYKPGLQEIDKKISEKEENMLNLLFDFILEKVNLNKQEDILSITK